MRMAVFSCLLIGLILLSPLHGLAKPSVSAINAVLMNERTGEVLFEKKAHEKQKIASITKIMTAIIAIESGKMNEMVKASKRAVYTEGSSIYLEQGEKMLLKDLVYGLMLRSGNDAAMAISEHVGGSMEGFVYLMNEKARWIGMTNTHFENPSGLDGEEHYSTAYDMALLMRYAMDNKIFERITKTEMYKSDTRDYAWKNKNKLLTTYYEYCTGGKTGYTKSAGRTLVSTASKEGVDLIVVTLQDPDDWIDHINLYEWGFEKADETTLATTETISTSSGFLERFEIIYRKIIGIDVNG
ncbi:D-alanyl-D-alanine carboxypeptidase family protein [Virgibacillus necropolis]|uniref:D-alanyl-D-alanine carboxypeptidase family protein n=1 Tax=Virgibacillus necropolis TaxID=163877 RepID=UPI003851400A